MSNIPITPTFYGWIETLEDALLVLGAARQGLPEYPLVHRRPHDHEKTALVRSGAIFVYCADFAGMKRWTDLRLWTASRHCGNFFFYRERDELLLDDIVVQPDDMAMSDRSSASRRHFERTVYGSWVKGTGFKAGGLMKKAFSLDVAGARYAIISYYNPFDVANGLLATPSSVPELASGGIEPELVANLSAYKKPPRLQMLPNGVLRCMPERNSAALPNVHRLGASGAADAKSPSMLQLANPSSDFMSSPSPHLSLGASGTPDNWNDALSSPLGSPTILSDNGSDTSFDSWDPHRWDDTVVFAQRSPGPMLTALHPVQPDGTDGLGPGDEVHGMQYHSPYWTHSTPPSEFVGPAY